MKSARSIKANSFLSYVYFNPLYRATRRVQRRIRTKVSKLRLPILRSGEGSK